MDDDGSTATIRYSTLQWIGTLLFVFITVREASTVVSCSTRYCARYPRVVHTIGLNSIPLYAMHTWAMNLYSYTLYTLLFLAHANYGQGQNPQQVGPYPQHPEVNQQAFSWDEMVHNISQDRVRAHMWSPNIRGTPGHAPDAQIPLANQHLWTPGPLPPQFPYGPSAAYPPQRPNHQQRQVGGEKSLLPSKVLIFKSLK